MLRSWRIGTVFGIPLYVHSTFLLLPLLVLVYTADADLLTQLFTHLLIVGIFVCVVLHELGHAMMARHYGIGTADITLYPIGGVARLRRMPEKPSQELAVALAGPAVNVVLALLLTPAVLVGNTIGMLESPLGAYTDGWDLAFLYLVMLWIANIAQLLFNMLPMFPMDGGRVLRSLLAMRLHPVKATTIAVYTGRVVLIGGIATLLIFARPFLSSHPMLLVVGAMVFMLGGQELAAVRHRHAQPSLGLPVGAVSAADEPPPGFTGIMWDHRSGVGVHWYNGRPVGTFTFPPSAS